VRKIVGLAESMRQSAAHLAPQGIAGRVRVPVVDRLQVVDVDEIEDRAGA
jgi:hypothetical protein